MKAKDLIKFWEPLLADAGNSWSIGTFGAIGEFHRAEGEAATRHDGADSLALATSKGAIRLEATSDFDVIAYDGLNSDGETWSQAVAFCAHRQTLSPSVITPLGEDAAAVLEGDKRSRLFDLGVGLGLVSMCVRTSDPGLIIALEDVAGEPLFGPAGGKVMPHVMRAQPHRVLLSPAGRVEIFQPIPKEGGDAPEGPHTHLLPKLLAKKRTHSANTPLPDGLQPVVSLFPRSPWRDGLGKRTPYNRAADDAFEALLAGHALPEDREIRKAIEEAVTQGVSPKSYAWPDTRRGRTQARITLRRLSVSRNDTSVGAWRNQYDHVPAEVEDDDGEAVAAQA